MNGGPVRICLIGALGRMGREIARATFLRKDVIIAAAVERPGHPDLGTDVGVAAGGTPLGVAVSADLETEIQKADVVVDLSARDVATSVLEAAQRVEKPLLCGTTGLSEETQGRFSRAAKNIAVLCASNLSPGVAVLAELVERASAALGEYDIEIVELHHRRKVDAPSGTAIFLADAAKRGRRDDGIPLRHGRSGHTGERPQSEIGMHAVRGGGIFGEHRVILAGPNERIEIVHTAESRALFAEGALRAVLFLARAQPGRYTMVDVMGRA